MSTKRGICPKCGLGTNLHRLKAVYGRQAHYECIFDRNGHLREDQRDYLIALNTADRRPSNAPEVNDTTARDTAALERVMEDMRREQNEAIQELTAEHAKETKELSDEIVRCQERLIAAENARDIVIGKLEVKEAQYKDVGLRIIKTEGVNERLTAEMAKARSENIQLYSTIAVLNDRLGGGAVTAAGPSAPESTDDAAAAAPAEGSAPIEDRVEDEPSLASATGVASEPGADDTATLAPPDATAIGQSAVNPASAETAKVAPPAATAMGDENDEEEEPAPAPVPAARPARRGVPRW
jgi:hypothetical protein